MPLILAGPGVTRRGIDTGQLLHATDVLPTILDFLGAERPGEGDGRCRLRRFTASRGSRG